MEFQNDEMFELCDSHEIKVNLLQKKTFLSRNINVILSFHIQEQKWSLLWVRLKSFLTLILAFNPVNFITDD